MSFDKHTNRIITLIQQTFVGGVSSSRKQAVCVRGRVSGRPRISEATVEQIQNAFLRSPQKSVRRVSYKLNIPKSSMWKRLLCRLVYKSYRLQLLQAIKPHDKRKLTDFSNFVLEQLENDKGFNEKLVFNYKGTFHLGGQVNRHNMRIWGIRRILGSFKNTNVTPRK